MDNVALDQVVELAFSLTISEQAKLLERVAAHLAREVEFTKETVAVDKLAGHFFEVGSPHDEGGTIAAMNQALAEHKKQKTMYNAG